jgi:hypothetical protein
VRRRALRHGHALLPDVIARTWGEQARPADGSVPVDTPFWPGAIKEVRDQHADFLCMAEAYWNLEATLQQQGFDYTYDKRLARRTPDRSSTTCARIPSSSGGRCGFSRTTTSRGPP